MANGEYFPTLIPGLLLGSLSAASAGGSGVVGGGGRPQSFYDSGRRAGRRREDSQAIGPAVCIRCGGGGSTLADRRARRRDCRRRRGKGKDEADEGGLISALLRSALASAGTTFFPAFSDRVCKDLFHGPNMLCDSGIRVSAPLVILK